MHRLRGEVKKGTTHDRLFARLCGLDSFPSQVKQKLGMRMFVVGDFIALIGMLVISESLNFEPAEGQSKVFQENGL